MVKFNFSNNMQKDSIVPEYGRVSQLQKEAEAALTRESESVKPLESHETKIVLLLCLLGAIRVFIFCAGFPFFNNVDEAMHFDLVLRYARGEVPTQIDDISTNAASYLGFMSSHEYFERADQFPDGKYPEPLWTLPAEKMKPVWTARSGIWETEYNYEISQPPLYYGLGGLWWHLGRWIGFHDGRLVYWLRFLNIVLVAALIWLAYATARLVFPDSLFVKLGVPAVVAFMPQSEFYSLGNDVVSALSFGLTFFLLIQWLRADRLSAGLGAALGLAFAASYLSKITNVPLLAITTLAVLLHAWQQSRRGQSRETGNAVAAFLVCGELPVIAWTVWCKSHFGDPTGSGVKAHFLGWTIKPFAQWWHHPIFSPAGLWTYLSGEFGTFWQGEFWWHGPRLCLPCTDNIYTLVSIVLLAAALPALWPRHFGAMSVQNKVLLLGLVCFIAELGFFGLMSIVYDFHNCANPSRDHPYFDAGRMMFGALIPFLLLFVYGLDRLLIRFGRTTKFAALTAMILAMVALEITTDWPAFGSAYNWFHLP